MTRKSVVFILFTQEIVLILLSMSWLLFKNFSYVINNGFYSLFKIAPFEGFSVSYNSILIAFSACIILLILSIIITYTYAPFKKALKEMDQLILQNIHSKDILPLAILSGVGEELFFRGLLQDGIGIVWTSIIFAILHIPGKDLIVYSLWALFASLYLGNIYAYTGNLFIVIVIHTLNNLIALILWKKFRYKFITESE